MELRYTVLGSGSSGNAGVLQCGRFGLLVDCGFGPRQLQSRLDRVGLSWNHINAAIITHTHNDHWNDRTLARFIDRKITFYCHRRHAAHLAARSDAFVQLRRRALIQTYNCDTPFAISDSLTCHPTEVSHDGDTTCAFRFEGQPDLFGESADIGYATDLGTWTTSLVDFFRNVNLLAIESNYDDTMERNSRRPAELIARVLGPNGHLSNDQCAAFVQTLVQHSDADSLQQIVLLHLSRQCNRQTLAVNTSRQALAEINARAEVHATTQARPGPSFTVRDGSKVKKRVLQTAKRNRENESDAPSLF